MRKLRNVEQRLLKFLIRNVLSNKWKNVLIFVLKMDFLVKRNNLQRIYERTKMFLSKNWNTICVHSSKAYVVL